jgi:hypothetical protein
MMTPAAPAHPGWSSLLDPEHGPVAAYERALAATHGMRDALRNPVQYLNGVDEDLAAIAAVRGPDATRPHWPLAAEPFARAVQWLGPAPSQAGLPGPALGLLGLAAVADACGASVTPPDFDPASWFEDLSLGQLDAGFRATLALLALGAGKPEEARLLFGSAGLPFAPGRVPGTDPQSLAQYLAAAVEAGADRAAIAPAWEAFLRAFPAALGAGEVEWRQLLAAARVVHGVLGGAPSGQVASALHGELLALAAEQAP